MSTERPTEFEGEFGNEGNPPGAKAPSTPAAGEFGGEGNPPGLRPKDADPDRRKHRDEAGQPVADEAGENS
jgi:hypothetical protein